MKNKVCIIACYFGKFPEWFDLWYKSASMNSKFNFLLITDQNVEKKVTNIKVLNMSLDNFSEYCSKKLNLKIEIHKPYKVCDFRPAYGMIFEEYLKEFTFWGHCDLDQIWGDLSKFIDDKILDEYDKINCCGHFTLYKNNPKIKSLYEHKGAAYSYKTVFQSDYNYAFDELSGINKIAKKAKIKMTTINWFIDIDKRYDVYMACNQENYKKQIFCYKDGKIIQYYIEENEEVKSKEFAYIHFQAKKPKVNTDLNDIDKSTIIINSIGFNKVNTDIQKKIIEDYSEDYSKIKEKNREFKLNQIKKFIKMPIKRKIIRVKQAIYKK